MTDESALSRLAGEMGVLRAYRDFGGVERRTAPETDRALLAAMGLPVETEDDAKAALEDRRRAARASPEDVVVVASEPSEIPLDPRRRWEITLEDDGSPSASGDGGALPALPSGVHRLSMEDETIRLIAAPQRAPSVEDVTGARRVWGVSAALYGLRSARNLGLGDYGDLHALAQAVGGNGAAFLGINPVHALGAAAPQGMVSPYSPSHRGFLDTRHIAVDDLWSYDGIGFSVRPRGRLPALTDYEAAAALAEHQLRRGFERFWSDMHLSSEGGSFRAFADRQGAALRDFARFEVLSLRYGPDWRTWPEEADRAGAAPEEEITRHMWLQWVADGQLAKANRGCAGLGLYLDLAVGARPGGAETWAGGGAHAVGATLGAPPDPFSDQVQSWGLAPFSPTGLAAQDYEPFRRILAAAMRHAGMIRIDHILGFARSFWIPQSGAPGAYVRYPLAALLAITRIEAARHDCVVVGEDLGLVPDGFRETLAASGLYGLDVMQFERGAGGGFAAAGEGRERAVACFGTHDAPTIRGYFSGSDLTWRVVLGRMDPADRERAMADRAKTEASLGPPMTARERRNAVHARLAASPAAICAVQFDDLGDAREQQNLPGTVNEHPNWRRRAAIAVADAGECEAMKETARIMAAAGRGKAD